jgi:hypothetical protein
MQSFRSRGPGAAAFPIALALAAALALPACKDEVVTACESLCDIRAEGAGCTDDHASACKESCYLYAGLDDDCTLKVDELFACERRTNWTCEASEVPVLVNDRSCEKKRTAYTAACESP